MGGRDANRHTLPSRAPINLKRNLEQDQDCACVQQQLGLLQMSRILDRVLLNDLARLGLANKVLQGITQTRLQNYPQNWERLIQQLCCS